MRPFFKSFQKKNLLTIHIVIAITCAKLHVYHEYCFRVLAIMGLEVRNEGTLVTIKKILKEYFFCFFQYFNHSIPLDHSPLQSPGFAASEYSKTT